MNKTPSITVSIKTLNEAQGIEKTIDSVRKQLQPYPHQIIVADSLSTDNTRELAVAKDAMVVCLDNAKDRCCGVGHQLGWLFSEGDYLLLLDGDMELEPGFLDNAVAFLETHPEYAGVAGSVEMDDAANYEFKSRKQRLHLIYPQGDTDHLGGGGLYRRSAIEKIGYLTNLNLHGYEEAELGIRLQAAGYKLHRLAAPPILAMHPIPCRPSKCWPIAGRTAFYGRRVSYYATAGEKSISPPRLRLFATN